MSITSQFKKKRKPDCATYQCKVAPLERNKIQTPFSGLWKHIWSSPCLSLQAQLLLSWPTPSHTGLSVPHIHQLPSHFEPLYRLVLLIFPWLVPSSLRSQHRVIASDIFFELSLYHHITTSLILHIPLITLWGYPFLLVYLIVVCPPPLKWKLHVYLVGPKTVPDNVPNAQ